MMLKTEAINRKLLPIMLILLISVSCTHELQSSQKLTLLRIQSLLNFPPFLDTLQDNTDLCNIDSTDSFTIVCYENNITQLHIIGKQNSPKLPQNFSIDSFMTTLVKLPNLKVLKLVSLGLWGELPEKLTRLSSLEILNLTSNFFKGSILHSISSLTHLQSVILDNNNFTGKLPHGVGSLSSLAVLSMKKNSLYGYLPHSMSNLENLRVLMLSNNNFSGEMPDFSRLTNLQVVDVENNSLGPHFPIIGNKIETIVLRNNKFTLGVPEKVLQSYYQLKHFDISLNRFVGPFPVSLLSLPSITYVDISQNRFTGMLFESLDCNDELQFVNFTTNLLTGKTPSCLLGKRVVEYADNCLGNGDGQSQHPVSFCKNAALAVGILPHSNERKHISKVILALSITGGIVGVVVTFGAVFLVGKSFFAKRTARKLPPSIIVENASTIYTSKLFKDARYITQTMKLGALGLPAYRTFSLEELEEATNNFDTSTFIGEGSTGQMYRGQLRDGSFVAIKCLKMNRNHWTQYFMPHIETISKLRHHHLASSLGHCFEYYLDDSSVSRLFLVFEYIPSGTLRYLISENRVQESFTWAQRIAAATGVAKGIQFLHTGIVPGLFCNKLKITDVLVDQNLVAKISSYNLPLLSENFGELEYKTPSVRNVEKLDIYDFGVILLEIITEKPVDSSNDLKIQIDEMQASIVTLEETSMKSTVTYSGESMKTMVEICSRCLLKDPNLRPSIEDVLWNLQFAAQVQDAFSQSSESSPLSPLNCLKSHNSVAYTDDL